MKKYRMLRVLEYVGSREFIDNCINQRGVKGSSPKGWNNNQGHITEAFIGELPEELGEFELNEEFQISDERVDATFKKDLYHSVSSILHQELNREK